MTSYWIKSPWWVKKFFSKDLVWNMPADGEPSVYLTFDDGPHPTATHFVLDQLKQHDAKGTFFCIGKNVVAYPDVYRDILAAGHTVGNHTHNHLNGWKNDHKTYLRNIWEAAKHIESRNFRPPYGRITLSQAKRLHLRRPEWRIYMWDVLSGDFDISLTPEQCIDNVIKNIEPGSIVVFHDSEKAWQRMRVALPAVLAYCKEQNWKLKALPQT